MTAEHLIQLFVVIVVAIALYQLISFTHIRRELFVFTWPVMTWLIHVLIFYAFVGLRDIGIFTIVEEFTIWSAILRFHAAFLILGGIFLLKNGYIEVYYLEET